MDENVSKTRDENQNNDASAHEKNAETDTGSAGIGGGGTPSDGGDTKPTEDGTSSKRWVVAGAIIVAVIIIGIALYSVSGGGLTTDGSRAVASVNGATITKSELDKRFAQSKQALQARGSNVTTEQEGELKKQILTSLVNEELLIQAARDAGISVSSDDVQARIDQVKSQFDGDSEFQQKLKENNLTLDGFRTTVHEQMLVQGYLDQAMSTGTVSVSDEEITEQYNRITSQASSSDEVPPLEQIRPMLKQQLQQQKVQQQRQRIVDELRKDAEIERNL